MGKFSKSVVLASFGLVVLGASAEPVQDSNTTARIQALSEQRAIAEAQAARNLSLKKLSESTGEAVDPNTARKNPSTRADLDLVVAPTVLYVEGPKGRLEAVIQVRNGVKQRVKVGDTVAGTTVKSISLYEVTVVDSKKQVTRLEFASTSQTQNGTNGQSGSQIPVVPMPMGSR